MKLCTFVSAGAHRLGVVEGDAVVDLSEAAPDLPREMTALLAAGDDPSDEALVEAHVEFLFQLFFSRRGRAA